MRRESDPTVMLGFVFVYMMIILIVFVVLAAIFLID